MRIGAVILNYNDYESTHELLEQIRIYASITVICVVDNCSSDNSWELLDRYSYCPQIHLIRNTVNNGYAAGNNIGCRYIVENDLADVIFIINPDVKIEENAFKKISSMFEKHAEYVALTGVMYAADGSIADRQYIRVPTYIQDFLLCFYSYNRFYERKYPAVIQCNGEIMQTDAIFGSMWAIRAQAMQSIDYMDEGTFLFYEELCTAMRLREYNSNWKIGVVTDVKYIHNHSVTIKKSSSELNTFIVYMRSKLYFEKKYHHLNKVNYGLLKFATLIATIEEAIKVRLSKLKYK